MAVRPQGDAGDLWRVLDGCQPVDGGLLLAPGDVERLVDVAAERFGLDRHKAYWNVLAYLPVFVSGGRWRVLYDLQREPLVATLAGLSEH
jgi:hypothetical protein